MKMRRTGTKEIWMLDQELIYGDEKIMEAATRGRIQRERKREKKKKKHENLMSTL